jgi:hypothetical protein
MKSEALQVNASTLAAVTLAALIVLSGCAGYAPGAKSSWDQQLKEMCARDGGVTVYERISISAEQFAKLGKVGAYASISPKWNMQADDVAFWEQSTMIIREGNPRVSRFEQVVRRRADEKIVARVVRYSRVGGDLPTGLAHESALTCPEEEQILAQREKIFRIEGERR